MEVISEEVIEGIREKVTKYKERVKTLEGVLKEINNAHREIKFKADRDTGISYLEMTEKKESGKRKKDKIAIILYNNESVDIAFMTDKKYYPILKEICDYYERKDLKDKPSIGLL